MKDSVYFLSDTHFTYHTREADESEKRRCFLEFLAAIRGAERLYLVGDIFDFWFEYRSVIPRHYGDIIAALASLSASGTRIFISGGNHDHWYGDYLPSAIGAIILPAAAIHSLQGRRVLITHGDTLMPGDRGYRALRALVRSRGTVALARLIHPDLLFAFAARFSRASQRITQRRTGLWADALMARAEKDFFEHGNDAFVMGHVHLPCLREFGARTFVILGDWATHRSFLSLREGRFSLERFQNDGKTLIETR